MIFVLFFVAETDEVKHVMSQSRIIKLNLHSLHCLSIKLSA